MIRLYSYWRSSAAYRVRIALHLKGLAFETIPVNLLRGAQNDDTYGEVNPQHLVPTLQDGGAVMTQSLAIIEYLDETYPSPALLPSDAVARARARAIALAIGADIHPLINRRVMLYLGDAPGFGAAEITAWQKHWIEGGLAAVEKMIDPAGPFSLGLMPMLPDLFIVPQLYSARRFGCDVAQFPKLLRVDAAACALDAFRRAHPDNQPDSVQPR